MNKNIRVMNKQIIVGGFNVFHRMPGTKGMQRREG